MKLLQVWWNQWYGRNDIKSLAGNRILSSQYISRQFTDNSNDSYITINEERGGGFRTAPIQHNSTSVFMTHEECTPTTQICGSRRTLHSVREELRRCSQHFHATGIQRPHRRGKIVLVMQVTFWKNNLNFMKHVAMIYVHLITAVIKTLVADKNNEALISYMSSYYSCTIYC